MPLTKLQSHILQVLAAGRSPDSYIAGGIAMNREGPRFSSDIDIFQDSEKRLAAAAETDAKALTEAGFTVAWTRNERLIRDADIVGPDGMTRLEWVFDSAFRFFPAQPDQLFGYVLHPVDLATNKVSAASDRRVPRDLVDLVTIHETILPLGAVICAAVGRFPGQSPEGRLADITRHSRFDASELETLELEKPLDMPDFHRRIRGMLEDAEQFIRRIPSDALGVVFLENGKPVQPDPEALEKYQRHSGAVGGVWPSAPQISSAMLEYYNVVGEGHTRQPKPTVRASGHVSLPTIDEQVAGKKTELEQLRPITRESYKALAEWYDVELTYTSNAIEGNTLTRSETAIVLEKGITVNGKPLRDHMEALGHKDALDYVHTLARRNEGIREIDMRQIHGLVVGRSDPEHAGRYSQHQRVISGSPVVLPSPAEIGPLMGDFARWLSDVPHNAETAIAAHETLVAIHPFTDGNGRTARLLMNLILWKGGYPPIVIGPEQRADYINGLEVLQQQQDPEPYRKFMTTRLEASLEHHITILRQGLRGKEFQPQPNPGDGGTPPPKPGGGGGFKIG